MFQRPFGEERTKGLERPPLGNMGQARRPLRNNTRKNNKNNNLSERVLYERQQCVVKELNKAAFKLVELSKIDPKAKNAIPHLREELLKQKAILEEMSHENQPVTPPMSKPTRRNNGRPPPPQPPHVNDLNAPYLEAPQCFKDPEEVNVTTNTKKRHLCDKNFTRRIIDEGGELDSIYATTKVIGSGSFGSVMNAEIRFHSVSGHPFKCVGVYKTERRKTAFLETDVAAEIACYARLLKKPCLSKGIFIKLATSDNKSVMENYISDLDHIFWSDKRPSTLIPRDIDLNEMVKAISYQMLTCLKGMHDEHIMHRDIKPANTFIAYDGEIVLGDFGGGFNVAIGFNNINSFYGIRGTPTYCAPEVRIAKYGPKCDLWSIGACIYEFITRSYLIDNDFFLRNPNDVYIRYVNSKVGRLHVNPDAKSLITSLLDSDAEARPSAETCLAHPWFAGMNLSKAQDIVVRSLNGQCMIKANKKIANTLTRHNRGVVKNDRSDAFMRIHEGIDWSAHSNPMRDTVVKGLFKSYVIRQEFRLIKFLHSVELFDRVIKIDVSILDNAISYMLSCAALAELLSSEGYTNNHWTPVFTSKGVASALTTITHKPVSVDAVERTMRNIIRLLGGDIFILRDGLVTQVAKEKPANVGELLTTIHDVVKVELEVEGDALNDRFESFSKKYF